MAKVGVVVVPFILKDTHFNFMVQTILSLFAMKTQHEMDVVAVINHCRPNSSDLEWMKLTFDQVILNDQNILARAWNKGIHTALDRGAEYVLVPNLDLLFHEHFLDNLIIFAQNHSEAIVWSGREFMDKELFEKEPGSELWHEGAHFSCFLTDARLCTLLGDFDEQFAPAYHEDSDMLHRAKLAGQITLRTESARFFHFDRMSIKGAKIENDQKYLDSISNHLDENLGRYKLKWGGPPGKEKYVTPYDKN